jgi:hypothetical protein
MLKAEEYKRRAAECQELAEKAPTEELRKTYRELATTWGKLAGERIEIILPGTERTHA